MKTKYFLTVENKEGGYLHHKEPFPSLEEVMLFISPRYLFNTTSPDRRNAWATITDGKLARLYITRGSAGILNIAPDIKKIDILTEEHLHKIETGNGSEHGRTDH